MACAGPGRARADRCWTAAWGTRPARASCCRCYCCCPAWPARGAGCAETAAFAAVLTSLRPPNAEWSSRPDQSDDGGGDAVVAAAAGDGGGWPGLRPTAQRKRRLRQQQRPRDGGASVRRRTSYWGRQRVAKRPPNHCRHPARRCGRRGHSARAATGSRPS